MKVLVIGSGGREHALVWKIAQSLRVSKIYCAPGNAGISQKAECVPIKAENISELIRFAEEKEIDLTVVGPEASLTKGIVDEFEKRNLRVFGPSKGASQLEGSKIFAKEIMLEAGVPTGKCEVFEDSDRAAQYIKSQPVPIVVKADGLAAGKGVIVAKTKEEALEAVELIMVKRAFGKAGDKIMIEECLVGEEASILAFCDGESFIPMVASQDHKAIYDGDKGPNTGGMGAYSPAPVINEDMMKTISSQVFQPIINKMEKKGMSYKGVLYAGLMITESGLKVLEFNVRFGDPETQVILPRLKTDLIDIMESCIDGKLNEASIEWRNETAVCVVIASGGYPGPYKKGEKIIGIKQAEELQDVVVFHAGTVLAGVDIATSGGRVLGVTALGANIEQAIDKAYKAVGEIHFNKMYFRSDIADKALKYL
ncbi:MAG: phosphoribosylamine--glycine ligase [bacterium]|nr:phosphoribosylamine--glycine ligase [bacterium]